MQERTSLEDALSGIGKVERELEDNIGMIELGEAENDSGVVAEAETALKNLKKEVARRDLEALLSGEADRVASYVEERDDRQHHTHHPPTQQTPAPTVWGGRRPGGGVPRVVRISPYDSNAR